MSGHPPMSPSSSTGLDSWFEQLLNSRKAFEGCLSAPTQYFEPLLSEAEAGKMLGLHPNTVQRLARRETYPRSALVATGDSVPVALTSGYTLDLGSAP